MHDILWFISLLAMSVYLGWLITATAVLVGIAIIIAALVLLVIWIRGLRRGPGA
jgi:hypothetical protein